MSKHCCGVCKGRLIEINAPERKEDGGYKPISKLSPKKKKKPTGFSLFMQENSARVREKLIKQRGKGVLQADVMRECSRLWKKSKENASSDNTDKVSMSDISNRLNSLNMKWINKK